MIFIDLFGKLTARHADGRVIPVTGQKAQCLVAYLALNVEMPPSRDRLTALFWGDRFTDQARQSLRQAVAKLRRLFEHPDGTAIIAEGDTVGFNPDLVTVDVDQVASLMRGGSTEEIMKAASLLKGMPLEGIYGQQADFDDWMVSERQRLSSLSLQVLERATEIELSAGNTEAALALARRIVAINPLRDAGQMVLIRILAQQGERAAAIQHFDAYEATLREELGVGAGQDLKRLISEVRGESFMAKTVDAETPDSPSAAEPAEPAHTSLAVVPFATFDGDEDTQFLANGLTDDITLSLSRFSWLDVRASGEVPGARLTGAQLSALGAELGIAYVVHGSLRWQGDAVRLTVQLAEASTGRYLWVSRYDRRGGDPFALQDELSETIAASLEAELERIEGHSAREVPFEKMNAWECYHRGLAIQYEFNADTNWLAQKHFRRAIELDPNFALAYARLSYAMVISAIYFEADVEPTLKEALDFADRAARLEPDDAVVRFAAGRVHLAMGNYDHSIIHLRAAIEANPGLAQAHCGLGDAMAYSGRLDEAVGCFEEAVRISPRDPYRWAFLSYGATAFLFKGDFDEAINWASEAETVPNAHYWPTAILVSALANKGDMARAKDALARLLKLRPGITRDFVRQRLFYLRDPNQIDLYLEGLEKAGLA